MSKKLGKPNSDADVVNKEPYVLLIGAGWVGQFCNAYFENADYVKSDGIITDKHGRESNNEKYELAIISVPTPMDPETGQCDISIVEKCVKDYKDKADYFLIKSTVEIGTTNYLAKKYNVKIAMSPEYIGETLGHKLTEPRRDTFLIIGGQKSTAGKIAEFWRTVLHAKSKIFLCSAVEAEVIKYSENYWIMRRVDYWNEVYDFCELFGANFDIVREGLVLDPRLGRTHSFVYPNNRGWSGKCLPKDMNALYHKLKQSGYDNATLKHLIEKNATVWRASYKDKNQLKPTKKIVLENKSEIDLPKKPIGKKKAYRASKKTLINIKKRR